jgi:hypothetical protein
MTILLVDDRALVGVNFAVVSMPFAQAIDRRLSEVLYFEQGTEKWAARR